jgi:hypothetical protein
MDPGVAVNTSAVQTGQQLLMRWCAATGTRQNAIEHPTFKDCYVDFVSDLVVSEARWLASDTTNVMPSTVHELSQMPLFEGCM